jgi:hypothetical protein
MSVSLTSTGVYLHHLIRSGDQKHQRLARKNRLRQFNGQVGKILPSFKVALPIHPRFSFLILLARKKRLRQGNRLLWLSKIPPSFTVALPIHPRFSFLILLAHIVKVIAFDG